jgi:hypothetical protein
MKKILALTLFLGVALVLSEGAYAQKFTKRKRYLSVGWSIGAVNYVGDLDPGQSFISPSLSKTGIHLGLFGGMYRWKPRVSFRGAISYNLIRGNDWESSASSGDAMFRKVRNLSFHNHILEVKADMMYDLFPNKGTYLKRPEYVPYAFIGLGFIYQNPYAYGTDDKIYNLRTMQNEGVLASPVQVVIPFGVGFRKKLNKEWDFAFEIGWRMTFTDYLDDVSGNYIANPSNPKFASRSSEQKVLDFAKQKGLPITADGKNLVGHFDAGDQRGTSSDNDWYIVTNFHLTKILKGGVRCPKFR